MNFLQKGLAGLESRLDKVLLDETEAAALAREREQRLAEQRAAVSTQSSPSRVSTDSPVRRSGESDRASTPGGGIQKLSMQERLAKALEGKRAASPSSALPRSVAVATSAPEPTVEDKNENENENGLEASNAAAGAQDSSTEAEALPVEEGEKGESEKKEMREGEEGEKGGEEEETQIGRERLPPHADGPVTAEATDAMPAEIDKAPANSLSKQATPALNNGQTREDLELTITRLQGDLIVCETRRQEETHAASERIDSLEEKIRYLARESAEASRQRATSGDGLEKKLAESQEKIALLLEEGEKLSKNELKLQTTIKKLRAKAQDDEKAAADTKRKLEKTEKEIAETKEKMRRAQDSEKAAQQRIKALGKAEAELTMLRREQETSKTTIAELRQRADAETVRAEEAVAKSQAEALEKERNTTAELRSQVERVQSEAALVEARLGSEVEELKTKLQRQADQAARREAELKAEQMVMESKMETLRARAEEITSGAAGDAHAKLLRKVETMQTQYALASENWQGIEGNLLSRLTSLERERDDLAKKERDVRKKAREMSLELKKMEADLENAVSKIKDLESDVPSLRERAVKLQASLDAAQSSFAMERANWERELQNRLDQERARWELESPRPPSPSIMPGRRVPPAPLSTTESYFLGHTRKPPSRPVSTEPPDTMSPVARKASYNNSAGFRTPPVRTDSMGMSSASFTPAEDDGDFFEGITPMSPQRHPDILSVSTIAAGPSVQLVERMSAAVRRLESEMAGSREEVARMMAQRDEARSEIVDLMREVEAKRAADERLRKLEGEIKDLTVKHETTLEMLGEKTERVAELEADVADLKQMYRDTLVSRYA